LFEITGGDMAREIKDYQSYQDRLLKLIPSEIVGAYMVLQGIIPAASAKWGTLIVSAILLIMTPAYLYRLQGVQRFSQLGVTTVSFAVWVYSLGGPFQYWNLYQPWIGSTILVLWTLTVPMIVNPQTDQNPTPTPTPA
jgi:magnesium-transporting ATPase (P-type)